MESRATEKRFLAGTVLFVLALIGGSCWAWPQYNVYRKTASGKATLAEAESSRRVAILEAMAKKESAVHLAQSEIERAKGIAEANRIIGHSLKDNPEYLTWLWIETLERGHNQVIYIPTEANLPILEAERFGTLGTRDSTR